jgi:predicted alpha/beta hydrolase family esterase
MESQVLIVPGLGNSGPRHWQTIWEQAHPAFRRVLQRDWDDPDLDAWSEAIDRAIREVRVPTVLIAHSFGCLAVAQRAARSPAGILGALLVAPADPDRWRVADRTTTVGPLGFPSILVASETDPWLEVSKACALARTWQSEFVNLGAVGHINAESGFGPWPEGEELLLTLLRMVESTPAFQRHGMRVDLSAHGSAAGNIDR